MNLLPQNIRKLMLPCEIEIEKIEENEADINQININPPSCDLNEEIFSGSTCCEKKKIEDIKNEDTSNLNK